MNIWTFRSPKKTARIQSFPHKFFVCKDLLAFEASANAFALVSVITHSLSARRWCCLAFFALFGAKRVSLSRNASLNFSAMDNSLGLETDGSVVLDINPETAQVFGSISLTIGSSNTTCSIASRGTSEPLKPKGDGFGFIIMRGHSTDKLSNESLSIFGCKKISC